MLLFMRAYERYQKIAPVRRFASSLTAAVIFGTALALTYGPKWNVLLSFAAAGTVGLVFHAAVWGALQV